MDLKLFYQKIRETENLIPEASVITVSLDTPDGGKSGVFAEVPKRLAARAIVENRSRLATSEEATAYRAEIQAAQQDFEARKLAAQTRFSMIPESELKALKSAIKPSK